MSGQGEWKPLHYESRQGGETWTFGKGGPPMKNGTYRIQFPNGYEQDAEILMQPEPWIIARTERMGMKLPLLPDCPLKFWIASAE